jgi:hypothetical protein
MRLRLGLLQDPAAIERQIQRELKDAEKKRMVKTATPTVKTEEEMKADEALHKRERKDVEDHVKAVHKPPRIRPLSENKAIETGANFIAETFLFFVAGGLILAESWRRDRKEKRQDADVADALATAEREREEMRQKMELLQAEIEALMDNKKPFDSVRAAAVASIRQIPSTTSTATTSEQDWKPSVTENTLATSTTTSPPTKEALASKARDPSPTTLAATNKKPAAVTKEPSAAERSAAARTTAQPSAKSEPLRRPPIEGKSEPSPPSSWLPSSWLGSGGTKPSAS